LQIIFLSFHFISFTPFLPFPRIHNPSSHLYILASFPVSLSKKYFLGVTRTTRIASSCTRMHCEEPETTEEDAEIAEIARAVAEEEEAEAAEAVSEHNCLVSCSRTQLC
jgi:hypothetical protein